MKHKYKKILRCKICSKKEIVNSISRTYCIECQKKLGTWQSKEVKK